MEERRRRENAPIPSQKNSRDLDIQKKSDLEGKHEGGCDDAPERETEGEKSRRIRVRGRAKSSDFLFFFFYEEHKAETFFLFSRGDEYLQKLEKRGGWKEVNELERERGGIFIAERKVKP